MSVPGAVAMPPHVPADLVVDVNIYAMLPSRSSHGRRSTGWVGRASPCAGDMVVLRTCLHGLDEALWDDAQAVDFAGRRRRAHASFVTGRSYD